MGTCGMGSTRVLVATEFRSYREAIAHVIGSLRPEAEVVVVDPDSLDAEVSRESAGFVICSRAMPLIETTVPVWVELHPDDGPDSRVGIRGETRTVGGIQLEDLLELLELTMGMPDASKNGTTPPGEPVPNAESG